MSAPDAGRPGPGARLRRLLVESVVIVASILAAFALDRWWDTREAHAEEQQVLGGLRAEFSAAKQELETYRELQRRIRLSLESTLAALEAAGARGEATVAVPDTALGLAYIAPTVNPSLATLAGLLASARLGVISDPELRSALAGWNGLFEELAEEEQECRLYVMQHVDPVLRSHIGVGTVRTIVLDMMDGGVSTEALARSTALPVDGDVIGVFAGRMFYVHHGIDEYQPVLEHVDRILRLIDGSAGDS